MKRKIIAFFTVINLFFVVQTAFSESKNIVYSENFVITSIENLKINLTYENLEISQIYGDEITVEISSNNLKKIPSVTLSKNQLKIATKTKKYTIGDNCTVSVYIPQDFNADFIQVSNVSGNILASELHTDNYISISNTSGRIDLTTCDCEYLELKSISGRIVAQKVSAEYFKADSSSGLIFLDLLKAPVAKSIAENVSGNIQLYLPENSHFDLEISSVSGSYLENKEIKKAPVTDLYKLFGNGGACIQAKTVSGNIELFSF